MFAHLSPPRRLSYGAPELGIADGRGNRDRNGLGDFVLHREDVGEIAIVALGPDVVAGFGFDELCADADAIARLPHAAFEHVAHTKLAPDLLHIDRLSFKSELRAARDNEQRGIARQRGDDVVGNAIGEELLLGVGAHIGGEGQH